MLRCSIHRFYMTEPGTRLLRGQCKIAQKVAWEVLCSMHIVEAVGDDTDNGDDDGCDNLRFALCCTARRQGTWAVPAIRPMEPSFRPKSFQKPSNLSAQAAGSGSPPGPRAKKVTFFLEGFSDPRVYRNHIQTHSGAAFLQR